MMKSTHVTVLLLVVLWSIEFHPSLASNGDASVGAPRKRRTASQRARLQDFLLRYRQSRNKLSNQKSASSMAKATPPGFHWENCGSATDPIKVTQLEVSPDPLPKKGTVLLTLHMTLLEEISEPVKVAMHTERKQMGSWMDIECNGFWGTCTYTDVCKMLNKMPTCPPQLLKQKMKCKCPFEKKNYALDESTIHVNMPDYATGEYRSKVIVSKEGRQLGCLNAYYNVE